MFRADPFRFELVEADLIIHPHGFGGIGIGSPFFVDAVIHIQHLVIGIIHLSGNHTGGRCRLRHLVIAFLRRKHITAFRTRRVSGVDERETLRTLLRRGITAFPGAGLFDLDHVERTVPQNVAPVVQKKAVGFSGFRTEARPPSGALNQQPRRIRRAEHHNAIRVRRIEAASQNVDVRQELERRLRCSEKIRRDEFPLEPGDDFSTFGRRRITGHDRTLLAGKRLDFFRNMLAMIH